MGKVNAITFVIAAGGLLLVCAAGSAVAQSSQPAPAALAPKVSPTMPRGQPAAPPDLLEGLTLANGQQAKIDQIRAETKSRIAAVDGDKKLSPEAADAMRRGYQRLENGRILEALTPEQQRQVRQRIAAWRASAGKQQYPSRRVAGPETAPRTP